MKKQLILLLFYFLSFSANLISQNQFLDSIYKEKATFYRNTNIDSTFFYAKKLEQSSSICKKNEGTVFMAYTLYRQKEYIKAINLLENLNKTIDSIFIISKKKLCLINSKVAIHNRLFWIYKNKENYNTAYSHLLILENLIQNSPIKDQKNYRNYLGILLSKAIIKNKLNMQEDAKNILLKAYSEFDNPMFKNIQDDSFFIQWKANTLNCLGNTYLSLNKKKQNTFHLDSSLYYYNKAFEVTKNFNPQHEDSEIIYTFKKTNVLIAKKEYSEALTLINSYKNIHRGYNYYNHENFQKMLCYYSLNNADSTIFYANKTVNSAKNNYERSRLITTYDVLSKQYNAINKLDSAYKYSKLTLQNYELAEKNKEKTFQLLYENNFKNAQAFNKTIEKRERKKRSQLIILSTLVIALLTLVFIYFFRKEKKKKQLILKNYSNKKIKKEPILKKEYNIDKALEKEILNQINKVTKNLDFLKPNFSITFIAEKLKTNATYVSFVFNKHHDESFNQYYIKRKIDYLTEKIKKDSTLKNYTIKALAEEIGYTNASAFTRVFKKYKGITPSEYIKSLKD